MKKLIMLSAIGILTMSSFSPKDTNNKINVKKETTLTQATWYYSCGDGRSGRFLCNGCTHEDALTIATSICQ